MELNEVQKRAVYSIDKDVTLMAGAGTGKTRVLTSRFINIVKNNINPREILAITFTKKAAQEMLARISKELVDNNIDFDDKVLNIMTIHSFALEIVENYSFLLGINPGFKILEEEDSKILLKRAVHDALNTIEDESYKSYLLNFKSSPFEEENNFFNLYCEFKNNNLDFQNILSKSLNFSKSNKTFKDLLLLLEDYRSVNGKKFSAFYDENIENIKNIEVYNLEILDEIEKNLGTSKKYTDKINGIKEIIQDLKKDLESENKDYYNVIIAILKEIDKNYINVKNRNKSLDYDDIISYSEKILKNPFVQKELQERYSYILVDEYQDTNEIQNEIISAFSSSNLFIVGDPKQSIYAFRGTDLASYFSFASGVKNRGLSLIMNKNYRSDGEIVKFINKTFENLINPYDEMEFNVENGGGVYLYNSAENSEIADLVEDLLNKYDPNDIAILSRSNAQIDEIGEILTARNIKFNKGDRKLREIEVLRVTKNILAALYSPKEFVETLSLFNSKLLKFNFEDLISILNSGIDNSKDLFNYEFSNENINNFLRFLYDLREKSQYFMIDEVIEEIMNYFYYLETLEENDWEYLYIFKEKSKEFIEKFSNDYRTFEKFLESMTFEDLGEGVNLLTIHKSKGLEFDALIISHMDKAKKLASSNRIIVDKDLGLGINSDLSNYSYKEISKKLRERDEEEEKRVLYVAMTRAKKELILFGNYEKANSSSYFSLLNDEINLKEYKLSANSKIVPTAKNFKTLDLDFNFENRIREYYTVTDFINYKRSPKDFYYKYFLGVDNYTKGKGNNQVIDPKTLGNIIHLFAYKYSKADVNERNIDGFLKDIFSYYEEEINFEKLNIARKLALNYLEMEEKVIIDKELLFYYDLEGFLVKGYIDQVLEKNGEYYIVDIKTSDMNIEELKETYENQLIIYSVIYENLYKVKVKAAYIFDLRGKNKIVLETNNEKYKKVMEEFLNYIKFLRSHRLLKDYL